MSIKKPTRNVFFGGKPPSQHLEAIGRFVHACSRLEATAHVTFRAYLGLPEEVARLLIGQPKIGELMSRFKSIVEVQKRDPVYLERLELLVPEIDYINQVRAMVAHNDFMWTKNTLQFHDSTVQKKGRAKTRVFQCALWQLTDCATYANRVGSQLRQLMRDDVTHLPRESLRQKLNLPDPPEKQLDNWLLELLRRPRS